MKEIWKDIEGYEGFYQVSNLGRVKNSKTGRLRTLTLTKQGYSRIGLFKNNKGTMVQIHILVAKHFIDNPNNYPCVLHKIAISKGGTNSVDNLYWGDYKMNAMDRVKDGTQVKRAVNQYTKEGEFVATFDSVTSAAASVGKRASDLAQALKGTRPTAQGYIWKYREAGL